MSYRMCIAEDDEQEIFPYDATVVWKEALQRLSVHDAHKNIDETTMVVITHKIDDIRKLCDICLNHTDLLNITEFREIHRILRAIDTIKMEIKHYLMCDENEQNLIYKFKQNLIDCFGKFEKGNCKDKKGKKRYKKLLEHMKVGDLGGLCSCVDSIDSINKIEDEINKIFKGCMVATAETTDNYPYPERIHKEEFDKLKEGGYENKFIQHCKKMHLIEQYAIEKHQKHAEMFMTNFLETPSVMNTTDVDMIAMELVNIHESMCELKKQVEKEPSYGVWMIHKQELFIKKLPV